MNVIRRYLDDDSVKVDTAAYATLYEEVKIEHEGTYGHQYYGQRWIQHPVHQFYRVGSVCGAVLQPTMGEELWLSGSEYVSTMLLDARVLMLSQSLSLQTSSGMVWLASLAGSSSTRSTLFGLPIWQPLL